jgi:DNA-binding Xre family transcriptional regulator
MTATPAERSAITTPLRATIAEEIRALLARRRINGVALAVQIGRSQSYVSRRLTGETAFDVDDLERIAKVLGVTVSQLLPDDQQGRGTGGYPFAAGQGHLRKIGHTDTHGEPTRQVPTRPPGRARKGWSGSGRPPGHPAEDLRMAA